MIIHITFAVHYLIKRRCFIGSPHLSLSRLLGSLSVTTQKVAAGHNYCVNSTKEMAASVLKTLSHTVILGLYSFTVYYTFAVLNVPFMNERFKKFDVGQLRYLTVWNLIAQTFFSAVCLLNDLIGSDDQDAKKIPFVRRFKDFFHATIGFPLSMFVGLLFWALMFVDRELVLPAAMDPYFPAWLNHLLHTYIMVTSLLEMFISPRSYPKRSQGLKAIAGFMVAYLAWMHFVYYKSGVWAYPVIEILSWPLRIVFYLVLLAVIVSLYFVGETLNWSIWGKNKKSIDRSNKKKK